MGILSSIGSGLGMGFLDPEAGYEDAMEELKKAWQQAQNFQRPYSEAGTGQLPFLNGARDKLSDPTKMLAEWMKSYETSPYAKDALERSSNAGKNEASAMGLLGSSGALENIQRNAGAIQSQDRQSYLNDLMQKYMASVGIGTNIYGTGAQTAANLGNQAMGFGQNMGGLAYGKANAWPSMIGQFIGAGANAMGAGGGAPGLGRF
jgi:hypothetical protein